MNDKLTAAPVYSVIVPVYNRIGEVSDLMSSLAMQSEKNFEVIIVEDGSTEKCDQVVAKWADQVDVHYYWKPNEGRSIARNYGIERSRGQWLIFFDSDCVIPHDYFKTLTAQLAAQPEPLDCFGGPDAASHDFNNMQKAISFSMTAFLTTGGIRGGGKVHLEKFVPRSFNMGYTRRVYDTVGGFREMFSEDIDMSTRIRKAGFRIGLIGDAYVYHKRRNTLKSFSRQTYVFGMSRITLKLLYPDSLKLVHTLPAVFVLGCTLCVVLALAWRWWCILPIVLYALMLWVSALWSTKSLTVACLAVVTSFTQLCSYGWGFIKAFTWKILLGHGRDVEQEIEMRRGK